MVASRERGAVNTGEWGGGVKSSYSFWLFISLTPRAKGVENQMAHQNICKQNVETKAGLIDWRRLLAGPCARALTAGIL